MKGRACLRSAVVVAIRSDGTCPNPGAGFGHQRVEYQFSVFAQVTPVAPTAGFPLATGEQCPEIMVQGKEPMLQVDLKETDAKIAKVVTDHCSPYGKVVSVKIHRSQSPFAMVDMANRMQTYEIAAQFGGSTIGTSALINLEQKS